MNEEELHALAEKLLAQGLDEDTIVEHLKRAAGPQEPGIGDYVAEGAKGVGDLVTGAARLPGQVIGGVAAAIPYDSQKAKNRPGSLSERYGIDPGPSHGSDLHPIRDMMKSIPMMGYDAEKRAIETEGPEKARALVGLGGLGLLGAGANRIGGGPSPFPGVARGAQSAVGAVKSGTRAVGKMIPGAAKATARVGGRAALNYAKAPFQPIIDAFAADAKATSKTPSTPPAAPKPAGEPFPSTGMKPRPEMDIPTYLRRAQSAPNGGDHQRIPGKIEQGLADLAKERGVGVEDVVADLHNGKIPRAPSPESETVSKELARASVQRGATKGQLAERSGKITKHYAEKVAGMSNDELQQEITRMTKRNDAAVPLLSDVLAAEVQRRAS